MTESDMAQRRSEAGSHDHEPDPVQEEVNGTGKAGVGRGQAGGSKLGSTEPRPADSPHPLADPVQEEVADKPFTTEKWHHGVGVFKKDAPRLVNPPPHDPVQEEVERVVRDIWSILGDAQAAEKAGDVIRPLVEKIKTLEMRLEIVKHLHDQRNP